MEGGSPALVNTIKGAKPVTGKCRGGLAPFFM